MSVWSIQLPDESEPSVTQTVSLEGRSYVFTMDWNSRTDRWTVGLRTQDGVDVIRGMILCMGIDLLRTVPGTLEHVPPGQLWLGGNDDPSLTSMGSVSLFYIDGDA